MDSIPWVHQSREEGSLDYNRGFVRLQIHMNFDTTINRQQVLLFEGPNQYKLAMFSMFRVLVCDLRVLSLRFHPYRTTKPQGLTLPWAVQISPSDSWRTR
jgi:hypothetical protein